MSPVGRREVLKTVYELRKQKKVSVETLPLLQQFVQFLRFQDGFCSMKQAERHFELDCAGFGPKLPIRHA